MHTVVSWLSHLFAALAAIPFLTFLLIFVIVFRMTDDRRFSLSIAMDVTTLPLILAVSALWQYVWGFSHGGWLSISLLFVLYALLALLQIRVKGKIEWRRLGRGGWRVAFGLFSVLYVILFLIGITIH